MKTTTFHFEDEIDAQAKAASFIQECIPKGYPASCDTYGLVNSTGSRVDGMIQCLWIGRCLLAQTIIVRNDANRSVLTCIDHREGAKNVERL